MRAATTYADTALLGIVSYPTCLSFDVILIPYGLQNVPFYTTQRVCLTKS